MTADHPQTAPGPVPSAQRIVPLDVLRGFALCGILVMNVRLFADIAATYVNPTAHGDFTGINYWVWYLTSLLAETKFMAIFSMLFGAGIVLMADRQVGAGRRSVFVHLRRMAVLFLIGLAHAYLIWAGDILVCYALCGTVVYFFRRLGPTILVALGLTVLAGGSAVSLFTYARLDGASPEERAEMLSWFNPTQYKIEAEIAAYRGSWSEQNRERWEAAFAAQTTELVYDLGWWAGGMMLLGMALFKLRFLDASRPAYVYGGFVAAALVVGLPVIAWGLHETQASGWEAGFSVFLAGQYNWWGSVLVALGWASLVMLVCQSARLGRFTRPLAAVGQMALTNYLLQSVVCTTIFYGHGLGLFASLTRAQQMGIVVAVWALQLVLSPIWLRYFRFGPVEWLWRASTYGRLPPIRRAPSACGASAGQPELSAPPVPPV